MRKLHVSFFIAIFAAVLIGGCSGSSMTPAPPGPQAAVVSVSMTDAPPAGITVLSFEVSLTGASLNPGNVDLLGGKGPIRIEVKKLETEAAFLSTNSVTAGNYTSLNLTFSNPELTFLNNTGATLAGCASGAVCEIKPTGTLTSTVNGTFNVATGSQSGILVDVNLSMLLSSTLGVDFSASGAVSASQQTKKVAGEIEDLDDVNGIVKTPANNQFTLQTTDLGNLTVSVDNNTQFEDFGTCTPANSSCLKDGQSVEADLLLMAGGGFLAKKIELHDDVAEAADDELDGVVFKVDSATQFEIVITDELRDVTNVTVGDPVTVVLSSSGASFQIDSNGLTVPSSLQQAFEGATDTSQLMPGQTVQIRKVSLTGGPAPAPITITTDRVRLRMTRFTAAVSGAPSGSNFNVGSLPGIFFSNGVSLIQVQTSSQTNFENVGGVSDLADANTVSLRGLLFKSTPTPVLLADKVRKR
jgi:hypothetical protein